jgi:hypothetical protein
VLGGFGEKTAVPRLDATSSRLLILDLLPELSTIVPPHHHSSVVGNDNGKEKEKRIWRALDVSFLVSPLSTRSRGRDVDDMGLERGNFRQELELVELRVPFYYL